MSAPTCIHRKSQETILSAAAITLSKGGEASFQSSELHKQNEGGTLVPKKAQNCPQPASQASLWKKDIRFQNVASFLFHFISLTTSLLLYCHTR